MRLGCLTLVASPGTADSSRVGLAVGRAVGSAVERNRVKRWIREAVRRGLPGLCGTWDVVVIASPRALEAGAGGVAQDIERGFSRLGEKRP
jgi:ribonuclease P protein component